MLITTVIQGKKYKQNNICRVLQKAMPSSQTWWYTPTINSSRTREASKGDEEFEVRVASSYKSKEM